jgi:hypothetical protein
MTLRVAAAERSNFKLLLGHLKAERQTRIAKSDSSARRGGDKASEMLSLKCSAQKRLGGDHDVAAAREAKNPRMGSFSVE